MDRFSWSLARTTRSGPSILAEIAIRRLQQHGHTYPFRHLSYEGAGHAIYIPYSPTTQIEYGHPNGVHYTGGGSPRANAEAGVDAWRHVLAFLEESAGSVERSGR